MALTVLCAGFVVLLVLGVPVAFAIGLACLATFAVEGLPFETAIQMMVSGMNVFSFLAIPFFIFSGELMLHGGIAAKIVDFARSLVGHWKGGLGLANVVASTLFGGVSGSPVADTSAMGGVMIPMMKREGYSAAYAVNVTTHASLSGALMPTSHNMIIYAFAAQAATGTIGSQVVKGVSIGDLMFAGLIPVFWIMVCMLVAAYWQAARYGYPKSAAGASMLRSFPGWAEVARTFVASLPGLGVIVIILFCVMRGITTATEAAAIAVTYSLVLTLAVYRTMTRENMMKSLARASKTTGVILLLIGVSNMLRYQMAYLEIPDAIESALLTATSSPWLMLLYINIIQIVLGIFLDMAAHILITTPLFLPLAIQMGVGPVQFGMMLLLNCALGLVHPPVGAVQFIGCAIGRISIGEATKTAWPYYLAIFVAITLVTYVPSFSTWLPTLITGHPVLLMAAGAAVYVSCAGSGELRVLHLDTAAGRLAAVESHTPGGNVMPIAVSPDGRFLFVARRSPPLEVLGFAISPRDGRLAPVGAAPLPASMASLATDRSGRWLFAASYGADCVSVSAIDAAGLPRPVHQVVATEPKAHAIHADPSNRFVFSTCLGGGVVRQFRFDAEAGRLTPNDPPAIAPHPGASPRHFAFSADGEVAWVVGELDGRVDVLRLDGTTGSLRPEQTVSALPDDFAGEAWAADIHATPDGRFLYVSERRRHVLTGLRIDPATGRLARLGDTPTEAQPRAFAISPDGRSLVVAGEASHHVGVHAIDAATGALSPRDRVPVGAGPAAVAIVGLAG